MPRSSIPNPAVLDSVKAGPPEVIALEHVASVEEATNSDHVLLGRAFACGKYVSRQYLSRFVQMFSDHV